MDTGIQLHVIEFQRRSDDGPAIEGPFSSKEAALERIDELSAALVYHEATVYNLATVVDEAEAAEDDEMPLDEPEDGEELITEIPVHGVATMEGRATGDGRGFRPGSLSFGSLPQPLGYEYVSTHGGETSMVAIVGRIDEFWTHDIGDGVSEARWRGVIFPHKPHAGEALDGIIDGSYTGNSVIIDSVAVDVEEQKERLMAHLKAGVESEDKSFDQMSPDELTAFVDEMVGDGKQEVTWLSEARIRRFDMVPTGAFIEGYMALGHEFADEMTPEAIEAAATALEDCGCGRMRTIRASASVEIVDLTGLTEEQLAEYDALDPAEQDAYAEEHGVIVAAAYRDVSTDERKKLADSGNAMPDGSFPIANEQDLKNAIQAIGRAKDPDAAKAHIKKRARELGKEDLIPEDWSLDGGLVAAANPPIVSGSQSPVEFAPGTKDGPGWITHPVATARIRRYWVRGKGAAKIRWGVPGDFNRCRMQLAKYVQNPDWLAGLCANMHKEAIGVWPGQEGGRRGHALVASGVKPAPLFSLVAAPLPVDADLFKEPANIMTAGGVVVEGEHIYGYIAEWNVCHIGQPEGPGTCTFAPRSAMNYANYRTGNVMTTEGIVPVGSITMDTGHAGGRLSARAAAAHYDNTGYVVADVACGENSRGIWFSGRLRPGVSDDDIYAIAASGQISGDWRMIGGNYELVASLLVNVGGYVVPNPALTASAELGAVSLVAAGISPHDFELEAQPSPEARELAMSPQDVAGIAILAVEEFIFRQERAAALEQLAPARAELQSLALKEARRKFSTLVKD